MKTRAAVLNEGERRFRIETLDLAPPGPGEVRVRVEAAGVCHSDWHLVTGDTKHVKPLVAGHEGCGVIEAVGEDVTRVKTGDRVVLNWAPACGSCFYCVNGRPSLCRTWTDPIWAGTMLDGTTRLSRGGESVYHFCGLACFAERCVVPEASCVVLPDGVPAQIGAVVGCAVATGVGAALNTTRVTPGASVAVFGVGGVGLCIVMAARLAGAATIIAVDPAAQRRVMAIGFGATHATDSADAAEALDAIRQCTDGRGADFVFEAVGRADVQEQALEAVRPGGELILVGLSPMGTTTNLPGAILTRREITVRGSYYGTCDPPRDFPRYAELFKSGKLPLDRLVSKRYALDEINQAYADMLAGRTARGVIAFD